MKFHSLCNVHVHTCMCMCVCLQVIFEPQEVSEVSQEIVMFCDNEQETTFTLKGTYTCTCVCTL